METTLLFKLLSGLLLGSAALYLLLLRPWRPTRMLEHVVPSIDLMFVVGLAFGVAALYEESVFPQLATLLVSETGLPESVAEVDRRIDDVEQLPARLWSDFVATLGWGGEGTATPPAAETHIDAGPGLVEATVVPAVTSVVEILLRTVVYWSALVVLALCQVMRLAVAAIRRFRRRERRAPVNGLATLDGRIAAIEARLAALPARAG